MQMEMEPWSVLYTSDSHASKRNPAEIWPNFYCTVPVFLVALTYRGRHTHSTRLLPEQNSSMSAAFLGPAEYDPERVVVKGDYRPS